MPKFVFNKLVRDKLPDFYERLGQTIVHQKLSGAALLLALRQKLVEEASEIPVDSDDRPQLVAEIADVQQVLDDMKAECGISDQEVAVAQQKKFASKGGFRDGVFVETIELRDDDTEWTEYYRREPQKYSEVDRVE